MSITAGDLNEIKKNQNQIILSVFTHKKIFNKIYVNIDSSFLVEEIIMLVSIIFIIFSVIWAILGSITGMKTKERYNYNTKQFERW